MINHRDVFDNEATDVFARIDLLAGPAEVPPQFDDDPPPTVEHMELLRDALALIQELWPVPYYASITLETHQWERLRKVLLAIPDLLTQAER